eukprot:1591247-Rhodomonas_salina.2
MGNVERYLGQAIEKAHGHRGFGGGARRVDIQRRGPALCGAQERAERRRECGRNGEERAHRHGAKRHSVDRHFALLSRPGGGHGGCRQTPTHFEQYKTQSTMPHFLNLVRDLGQWPGRINLEFGVCN